MGPQTSGHLSERNIEEKDKMHGEFNGVTNML